MFLGYSHRSWLASHRLRVDMMSSKRRKSIWQAAWADALNAMSLGWELGLPICAGAVLGHYLDVRLETGYTMTMGLLMLGIMVGVYNVARKIQRLIEQDRYRAEQEKAAEEYPEEE